MNLKWKIFEPKFCYKKEQTRHHHHIKKLKEQVEPTPRVRRIQKVQATNIANHD